MASNEKVIALKDKIDRSLVKDVKIRSLMQGRQPCKQMGNSLEEIERNVLDDPNISLFPRNYEAGQPLAHLKDRIRELSTDGQIGLAYIGTSLAISANIQIDQAKPDDVIFDVILIRQKHPTIVLSVFKSSVTTLKHAKRYNALLSKGVTRSIRSFMSDTFITVHGVLNESSLTSRTDFQAKLDIIVKETSRLCIPDALTMSIDKYQIVTRAFLSSIAALTIVESDGPDGSQDATWFLTLQQFCILTENIDRHDVHVYAAPSSGGSVLSLAVGQRLEKKGKTLIITDDEKHLTLARKKNLNAVKPRDFSTEEYMDGVVNVIISGTRDVNKSVRCQLPEMQTLWVFERLEAGETVMAEELDHIEMKSQNIEFSKVSSSVGNIFEAQREVILHNKSVSSEKDLSLGRKEQYGPTPDVIDVPRVRIEGRTSQEIGEICCHGKETKAFHMTLDKLLSTGIVTLIGSPGDGKTTIAYLILKELKEKGYTPLRIKSPDEYFNSVTFEREAVMIESVFGFENYDIAMYHQWLPVLTDISQRIRYQKKIQVYFLITSRDYIFSEAAQGREELPVTENVCNITVESPLTYEERKMMIQSREKYYSVHLNEKDVDEVSESELPFGFPFSCENFFQKNRAPETFVTHMINPASFLILVVQGLFSDASKQKLLILLLKQRGKMDLSYLRKLVSEEGYQQLNIRRQVDILNGSLLIQQGNVVRFSHKSVHIAVASVLGFNDPELCISVTKLSILAHVIHSGNSSPLNGQMKVNDDLLPALTQRLQRSIDVGTIHRTLSMKVFCDTAFVTQMLSKFSDICALLKKNDEKKHLPFAYFVTANGGTILLKKILSYQSFRYDDMIHVLRGCCEFGSVPALKIILARFPHLLSRVSDALHICGTTDNEHICALLLQNGAKMNTTDKEQNTPVHTCASMGSINCLKVMLEFSKESVWDAVNRECKSALHVALEHRYDNIGFLLYEHTDCEIQDRDGRTALHVACEKGMHGIVAALLKKSNTALLRDRQGHTALHAAATSGSLRTIQEVLEFVKIDDINARSIKGTTPLQSLPTLPTAVECYDLLLKSGAEPLITDEVGNTVLHTYSKKGSLPLTKNILRVNNVLMNKLNRNGQTPLHLASGSGNVEIVKYLLKSGAEAQMKDASGFTPLSFACSEGHLPVVKELATPPALADENEVSALHESASSGQNLVVEYLLDIGYDVDARNADGWTALHIATFMGHLNVVQILLGRGSSVNATIQTSPDTENTNYPFGSTALHIASSLGHLDIVEELLNNGIDMNIENDDNDKAKDYARDELFSLLSTQENMTRKQPYRYN